MVSVSNCDLIVSNAYMGNENYHPSNTQCNYREVSAYRLYTRKTTRQSDILYVWPLVSEGAHGLSQCISTTFLQ